MDNAGQIILKYTTHWWWCYLRPGAVCCRRRGDGVAYHHPRCLLVLRQRHPKPGLVEHTGVFEDTCGGDRDESETAMTQLRAAASLAQMERDNRIMEMWPPYEQLS